MDPSGQHIMPFLILLRFVLFLNLRIIASVDNKETEAVILSMLRSPTPIYVRLGKHSITNIHKDTLKINISKASVIKKEKMFSYLPLARLFRFVLMLLKNSKI